MGSRCRSWMWKMEMNQMNWMAEARSSRSSELGQWPCRAEDVYVGLFYWCRFRNVPKVSTSNVIYPTDVNGICTSPLTNVFFFFPYPTLVVSQMVAREMIIFPSASAKLQFVGGFSMIFDWSYPYDLLSPSKRNVVSLLSFCTFFLLLYRCNPRQITGIVSWQFITGDNFWSLVVDQICIPVLLFIEHQNWWLYIISKDIKLSIALSNHDIHRWPWYSRWNSCCLIRLIMMNNGYG